MLSVEAADAAPLHYCYTQICSEPVSSVLSISEMLPLELQQYSTTTASVTACQAVAQYY